MERGEHAAQAMSGEADGYRSYVIRVWPRQASSARQARAVIEEVQSGRQVELNGEPAAEIGIRISAALSAAAERAGDVRRTAASGREE